MPIVASVSSASATAGLRRIRLPKPLYIVAATVGVVLLVLGILGKRQAAREAKLMEIASLRDQLQRHLEIAYGGTHETAAQTASPDASAVVLAEELEGRVLQFQRRHRGDTHLTPGAESFELHLATATAANATKQFGAALDPLAAYDESGAWSAVPRGLGRVEDLLQARGDSFFGLNRWREAADHYQQILGRQPDRAELRLRLAECQSRLGEHAKATATRTDSARLLKEGAERDLQQGRFDSAVPNLEKALETLRRLYEEEGQAHLDRDYVGLLTTLAWVYAGAPDLRIRDAARAQYYARKACEVSHWQSFRAVEALAAALAEARDFKEAVRLQGKAIELAPAAQRGPLQAALETYTAASAPARQAPSPKP